MATKGKDQKMSQPLSATKKFVDYLKSKDLDKEEFDLHYKATEAENRSRTEILEIIKDINDCKKSIVDTMYDSNFSLSRLYERETKLTLLTKKLTWMEEKFNELF